MLVMLRALYMQRLVLSLPNIIRSFGGQRYLNSSVESPIESSEEDQRAARQWLAGYSEGSISRSLCEISFSRSSGPGGQNVNKTNSKATLRLNLRELLPLLPSLLHRKLQASRYYAERSNSLVIQADSSRKQADNVQECYKKLDNLILSIAKTVIRGETSKSQAAKVEKFKRAENGARMTNKKLHSFKKTSRKGPGFQD